jgi:hypothetical protein
LDSIKPPVPAPKPRRGVVERLPVVTFKWAGHIPYSGQDVNIIARQVDRWLARPHELVCVTDDAQGIDGGVRTIPLWRDHFEHGRDWHRLKLFAEEMADLIGPRFVCLDLDTVICDWLDPLFETDAPFKAWRDPNRANQYCTSLFMMDAGAYPHVYENFDVERALSLRESGKFTGYDQAWISEVLPGMPVWTPDDGVISFKADVIRSNDLKLADPRSRHRPEGVRLVNFHGRFNPRDPDVQEACPWIADLYR